MLIEGERRESVARVLVYTIYLGLPAIFLLGQAAVCLAMDVSVLLALVVPGPVLIGAIIAFRHQRDRPRSWPAAGTILGAFNGLYGMLYPLLLESAPLMIVLIFLIPVVGIGGGRLLGIIAQRLVLGVPARRRRKWRRYLFLRG
ncbi:MAG TPA: hypothetical protein VIL71_04245 [Spirillospora sp.]